MTVQPLEQSEPRFIPRRSPGRIVGVVIVVIIIAAIVYSLVTNQHFGWPIVFRYVFNPSILGGLWLTIALTVIAMVIGLVLGVVLAVMRISRSALLRGASGVYIWFFRGTPVLVQLVFWYNLAYLYPSLHLGIPFLPPFFSVNTNSVITPLTAAILGLSLNEGAYLAEIVRAGIIAVPRGQGEAATSLGMTRLQSFVQIVLPQAMRVIIPPAGNETIGMLKTTSLVSVIALADLMYSAQSIYAVNYETVPLLICVSLWYLLLTSLFSIGQSVIERYYGRGTGVAAQVGGLEKAFGLRLPARRKTGATR
ncbi:MAG: Polar amino acid transport system permease protein [Frondihabitans sp.]|nr:Polar amino acid transport system permease protein [Frondihabitans sp.]